MLFLSSVSPSFVSTGWVGIYYVILLQENQSDVQQKLSLLFPPHQCVLNLLVGGGQSISHGGRLFVHPFDLQDCCFDLSFCVLQRPRQLTDLGAGDGEALPAFDVSNRGLCSVVAFLVAIFAAFSARTAFSSCSSRSCSAALCPFSAFLSSRTSYSPPFDSL